MSCALCGFQYVPGGDACRTSGCPLSFGGCRREHCPRCGYSVPSADGGLVGWLRRRLSAPATVETAGPRRLTEAPVDTDIVVERIDAAPDIAGLLTVLGVTPGSTLRVCQRFPTYVVRVEATEMAFERNVAESVWVR